MNGADPRPEPDDGIPVLTDVVDSGLLPLPEAPADADRDAAGPPSLAMFPELEAQPAQDRAATQEEPVEPALPAPLPQPWQEIPAAQTSFAPAAGANDQGFHAAASTGDAPRLPDVPAPADAEPLTAALAPPHEAGHVPPAPAAAAPATAAVPPAPPPETRDEMQTRIFEALAARLDRLLDQRLEPVVHGVIDAAFAGVKAGLAATVNQALREAVEQAVRDEFENRPD